jgi:branched-chain amino acid transport system substrate-binding protein
MYQKNGYLRADGRMVHDMYLMEGEGPGRIEVSVGLLQAGATIPASRRGPPRPKPSAAWK